MKNNELCENIFLTLLNPFKMNIHYTNSNLLNNNSLFEGGLCGLKGRFESQLKSYLTGSKKFNSLRS